MRAWSKIRDAYYTWLFRREVAAYVRRHPITERDLEQYGEMTRDVSMFEEEPRWWEEGW